MPIFCDSNSCFSFPALTGSYACVRLPAKEVRHVGRLKEEGGLRSSKIRGWQKTAFRVCGYGSTPQCPSKEAEIMMMPNANHGGDHMNGG